MEIDDTLANAIADEAARRSLKATATCQYCGEVFTERSVSDLLGHRDVCFRKTRKPLSDLAKPSKSD